jgi:serine/threonine protein kinase
VNPPTNQLKAFYDQVSHFTQPEELFGNLGSTPRQQMDQLEVSFKSLMKLYHPDRFANYPSTLPYVTEISKYINELKRLALTKIQANVYGSGPADGASSFIQTPLHEFFITDLLVEGALADVFRGFFLDPGDPQQPKKEVVVKIIADPRMNALIQREVDFYQTLTHFCFPSYVDNFRTSEGKRAIVLSYIPGSVDLFELTRRYRRKYQAPGLPQEHLVWILDRFLAGLGLLHRRGILHGNLQPDNLVIQPHNHNGLLIDFLHCRIDPDPDEVFSVVNPVYCAPEVLTRHFKPHPVSDIYALGCCMIEMLGGAGGGLDDAITVHPALRQLLQKMVLPDPAQRANDAWALAAELKKLRQQIYGAKPQFISLDIGD